MRLFRICVSFKNFEPGSKFEKETYFLPFTWCEPFVVEYRRRIACRFASVRVEGNALPQRAHYLEIRKI
jgi:hypothetical protein